ncbi:hypothetical protein EBT25_07300 [bacterium]|jgi:phage baseplate assembly protein W|nr:hypothetical protein [bacterium]
MVALVKKPQTTTRVKAVYSDFTTSFEVASNGDLIRVVNEDSVKESIKNLLLTNRGERIYSEAGSDLNALLFENMSMGLDAEAADLIASTIENFEPRARVADVSVSLDYEQGALAATIVFVTINNERPQTLDVIINRIR